MPTSTPIGLLRGLVAVAGLALAVPAWAQTGSAAAGASLESMKARLSDAQAGKDLEPGLKARVMDVYAQAVAALEGAETLRAEIEAARKTLDRAPETIRQLERELRSVRAESTSRAGLDDLGNLPPDALERLEGRMREEVEQTRVRAAELQRRFDAVVARPLSARIEQAELRDDLSDRDTQGSGSPAIGVPAALLAAQRDLARAREAMRQARLAHVDHEIVALPALARIAELELAVKQAELDVRMAAWTRMRTLLEERQRAEIARARGEAARARQPGAGLVDPAREIEARGLERRAQIAENSLAASAALAELSERRQRLADLEQTLRATKRRAEIVAEGRDLAQVLLRQIEILPAPDRYRRSATMRATALAQAANARLDVDLERAKVADLERAVAEAMTTLGADTPAAARAGIERRVRANLAELQQLVERLDKQLDVLLQTLRATHDAESALLLRARDVGVELRRLLFWIRVSPVSLETFSSLGPAAEWFLSGANWRGVTQTWQRAAQRDPILLILAAIAFAALLAARGWLKRKLPTLAPGAIPLHAFRVHHTFEALAFSLLLALPLPFAIWTAGFMLEMTRDAPLFAQGAGLAFRFTAGIVLFFRALRWLFDPGGVAIKHFGWNPDRVLTARRGLQQLLVLYAPLVFVVVVATVHAPESMRQSLGRMAFVLAMIAVAVFWRRALHPDRPIARIDQDESTIGVRLIAGVMVRAPVWLGPALVVLSLAGYHYLAIYLHEFLLLTILLVFTVAIGYGLVSLWLTVQRLRLAEMEAQQARAAAQAQPDGSDESPMVRVHEIDAVEIDAQTRKLVNMLATIVLGGGLWLIWSRGFTTLDLGADAPLWTYTETVDGKKVSREISLTGVLLALAVGMVTYIGTRNIGGMLDILLLQRVRFAPDANYAIKTVARYATAGIGIVMATNLLGISWSSAQWLVAALGVGLGFGLQEIVANFVSGLIVLGERPIRLGDLVTVGETSGTVTRIRARATVITDWDNKEVLIPNKAFITERVINWTLSNPTTRLLLKVGVAYGTDPVRVEKVLAEVVRANANVLEDPAPSVFFMGFGDSSLDFEIRAYVDATSKRLQTTHELNVAIAAALADAGIEIPFPQRDLHIRSADGLGGLGQGTPS